MGLLDFMQDPKQAGLLMAAARMAEMSGPSRTPVGIGQILGGGLGAFMQTNQAMKQQQMQDAEQEQMQQYRGMQMQGMEQQQQAAKAALQRAQVAEMALKGYKSPRTQAIGQMSGPTVANAAQLEQMPQGGDMYGDLMGRAQALRDAGLMPEALQMAEVASKFKPKFDTTPRVANGPDGKPFTYVMDEMGNPKRLDGFLPREEKKLLNLNNKFQAVNPFDVANGATFDIGRSADNVASVGATLARLKFDKDQAAAPIFNADAGVFVNRPTAQNPSGSVTPIEGFNRAGKVVAEQEAKRASASRALLPVLDQAEKLIDGATGSYAGAGVDQAARFFGKSTDGAKVTAQLKVLEGQIMMNQPRMEGPQSNMDMQLYRQMAGQIGDPTTPVETRKAALQGIRAFHQKYAGQGGASGDWDNAPQRTVVRTGTHNGRKVVQYSDGSTEYAD